jgi:hypothetical protein
MSRLMRGGGGGQGAHKKPIGCGASGAYAPGSDDDEEEEEEELFYFCYLPMRPKHDRKFADYGYYL